MKDDYGFKVVWFKDIPAELWDRWVSKLGCSSYLHSSGFLRFLHAMVQEEQACSFACIQDDDRPLALCPAAVCRNNLAGADFLDASWNGAPLGMPVWADASQGGNDKLGEKVFELFHDVIRERGAQRSYIRRHPVSLRMLESHAESASSQLYPLKHGYACQAQNTIVIDLRKSEESLSADLSQYQRKHVRRSLREGVHVVECNAASADIDSLFVLYQQAHVLSAGRLTRPQRSFDLMREAIIKGEATLFIARAQDQPISFLYCGEFHRFAFGWSQVNLDEFEKRYSPRHLLEWQALLAYKRRGFSFYEVGTYWAGPQLYKIPSPKELSIAEFKRRYGGIWMAELCFERFFNRHLFRQAQECRLENFLASGYFDQPSSERTSSCEDNA